MATISLIALQAPSLPAAVGARSHRLRNRGFLLLKRRINLTFSGRESRLFRAHSGEGREAEEHEDEEFVEDLKVPDEWTSASAAAEESEWLRKSLKQWLDDEYCPEPANVEISKRCATVYYRCLVEKEVDAANILMRMVENLETFSFKHSFHGAFSSANAAMDLIIKRANSSENNSNL